LNVHCCCDRDVVVLLLGLTLLSITIFHDAMKKGIEGEDIFMFFFAAASLPLNCVTRNLSFQSGLIFSLFFP
jgi:hypothetical protein